MPPVNAAPFSRSALASLIDTLRAAEIVTLPKSFDVLVSVMSLVVPALKVAEPLTTSAELACCRMLLSAVGPLLVTLSVAVVMLASVTLPLAVLVLPAPSRRSMVTVPVPAFMVVPFACEMTAAPASRCASTTPLASFSLPISTTLPLSVVMLALIRIERPACIVRLPPLPAALVTMSAPACCVMSLFACRMTFEPVLVIAVISAGVSVCVALGVSAKSDEPEKLDVPTLTT